MNQKYKVALAKALTILALLAIPAIYCFGVDAIPINLTVHGQARQALLTLPAVSVADGQAPVLFCFHGHGGTMQAAQKKFQCDQYWPQAIAVYPQGLPSAGGVVDKAGKLPGWQLNAGDNEDRDLAFFDALVDYLKQNYKIGDRKIYLIGHSNGAVFSYLVWANRSSQVGAICPIAGILPTRLDRSSLIPVPVFHVAGKNDPLVKFSWQQATINFIKHLNQCEADPPSQNQFVSTYQSKIGIPLSTYIDNGGHEMPEGIMEFIIKFLKDIK